MVTQRIRLRFRKTGDLKAISHLDLMRAFERALRRTGLPLRMSEGFNPHPRLSFPAALGVGIEGLDEVMEFELSDWVLPRDVERRVKEQLPAGLEAISLELGNPHESARVTEVTYRVTPKPDMESDPRLQAEAVARLMAQAEIPMPRMRKGREKVVNIRSFILALDRDAESLTVRLKAGPEGSAHPEEILGALGFDEKSRRSGFVIARTRVQLAN
jgi:radical SAM-linked protein